MTRLDGQITQQATTLTAEMSETTTLGGNMNAVPTGAGGIQYKAGDHISIEKGVISVLTADQVETDNTKPVTSAAVATQVGNIDILLQTI